MNLIVELPQSVEAAAAWLLTRQIRQLDLVHSAIYMSCDKMDSSCGGDEIWIEFDYQLCLDGQRQVSMVETVAMLVRDAVSFGATLRLKDDIVIEV